MFLKYTDKMRSELLELIDSAAGIELVGKEKGWQKSKTAPSYYLQFKKDSIRFAIKVSDNDRGNNEVVCRDFRYKQGGYELYRDAVTWIIDASSGGIMPGKICEVIDFLYDLLITYDTYEGLEDIKEVAIRHKMIPMGCDDVCMWEYKLADIFMTDHGIVDDDYCITRKLMRVLCRQVLGAMSVEDFDETDE